MKLALIEIPYGHRLAIAFDQLGMLQHSTVITEDGHDEDYKPKFSVSPPNKRIGIEVRDDAEIGPYVNPNEVEVSETESDVEVRQRLALMNGLLQRFLDGETIPGDEIRALVVPFAAPAVIDPDDGRPF